MTASPSPVRATAGSIAARLERLPNSRWQTKLRVLLGTVTFFEGFDQMLVSYTLPLIKTEWSLSAWDQTAAVTTGSVGMLLGALLCGKPADRFGRIRIVTAAMLVTAISSLLLVVCPNFGLFALLRFIQGAGIGAEVPVAAAFISEISRARGRGRFVMLYELAFPAGLTGAALIASVIVPALGWRALYLIGAVPAVLAFFVRKHIPESPRWLVTHGHLDRAEAAITAIERGVQAATRSELPPIESTVDKTREQRGRLGELLVPPYLKRTVIVSVLWFGGYFVNYGLTAWLPTLYTSRYHLPIGTALNYTLLTSISGFLGCVALALLVDKIGRRLGIAAGLGLGGVLLVILALLGARTGGAVALWCTLSALFVFAANICMYLYTPELYPTRIRGLGASFGGAWARAGVIVGPVVVGALMAVSTSQVAVFGVLGAVGVVTGAVALGAEETSGRRLEEISS